MSFWDSIKSAANAVANGVSGAANTVAHGVTDAANTVARGVTGAANTVADGATVAGKAIASGATTAATGAAGLVTGDTYFPDNPAREARAKELASDVSAINDRIVIDNGQVKKSLIDLTATIESVYRKAGVAPPAMAMPGTVDFHQTAYEVSGLVAPMLSVAAISAAMQSSAVVGELAAGEIGAETAAAELGAAGLGLGPAVVVMAAITAAIGAMQGAEKRSKLQSYIHQTFALRQRQKTAELTDMKLLNVVLGLSSAVASLKGLGLDEAKITARVKALIAKAEEVLKEDLGPEAASQLTAMDASRHSWTNEDR